MDLLPQKDHQLLLFTVQVLNLSSDGKGSEKTVWSSVGSQCCKTKMLCISGHLAFYVA